MAGSERRAERGHAVDRRVLDASIEILEQQGLEVYLVNAQHTKNVPGRKSDVQECQWLLKLRAFGLLNNSFQPTDEIRISRTLWRHRGNLVAEATSVIQRMQKVLTEMNVHEEIAGTRQQNSH